MVRTSPRGGCTPSGEGEGEAKPFEGGALQTSRFACRGRRILPAVLLGLLLIGTRAAAGQGTPRALGGDSLRVVYWEGQRALAERAYRTATATVVLPGIPAGSVRLAGTIFLAPFPSVFDSLTGGNAPEWSAGVAIPSRRSIVLPAFVSSRTPQGDPIVALRHEIAHLALNAYLPGRVPRWFDEGYATWASGEWDEGSGWRIRLALLTGAAPPLDSLRLEWPAEAERARLAYLLSASAVRHLATRSGPEGFAALLAEWRREGTLDAAIRSTYQMTLTQYEREWRGVVRRRYGWLLAIAQVGAFWLFLAVLVLALGWMRRSRDRRRLEEMEQAPPPEGETWWIEAPPEGTGLDAPGRRE